MKITMEDGERWANVRDTSERFKSWERRGLYERFDATEGGMAIKELTVIRYMIAHLLRDWSLDLPLPKAVYTTGSISYENLDSLDQLDTDMEDELLAVGAKWTKQIAINFAPQPDPESPTKPSGD